MAPPAGACRLAALQSRRPPSFAAGGVRSCRSCELAACADAAAALLLLLLLLVCSHGFSLRHCSVLLISTTIYGNPLSSQRGVTSRGRTSHTGDDTLCLCMRAIIILLQCERVGRWGRGGGGGGGGDGFSLCPPIRCSSSSRYPALASCCVL